jgi:hypothetical protein
MADDTSSTVPGCRMPHVGLKDGRSLYDAMGPAFTLVRFDTKIDAAALEAAARERRLPLKILDVEPKNAAGLDAGGLVLSRPDQHVAWRGDRAPDSPAALTRRVRGAEH